MLLPPQLARSQHLLLTRTAPIRRLLQPATRHIFDYRPTKPLTDRMDEYTKKTKSILPFLLAKLADHDADTPASDLPPIPLAVLPLLRRSLWSLPPDIRPPSHSSQSSP